MFNLKVTKQDGSIEQSDFATNQEALDWKIHLESLGYNFSESIVHYDAIEAKEAILDESGIELSPAIEAVAACDETIPAPYSFEISSINPPIEDISPRQIRMALLSLGLAENAIDGAISNLSSPQKEQAMIAWKYSTTFKREAEAVSMIGSLLSLSSEQLDQIWKIGSNL